MPRKDIHPSERDLRSYTRAREMNPCFKAGFDYLKLAFAKHGAYLDSPSIDGFVRCVSLPDGRQIVFSADAFPLNSAAAVSLARDKLATYQLLTKRGIFVPRGIACFAKTFRGHATGVESHMLIQNLRDSIPSFFSRANGRDYNVFVKPGRESGGFLGAPCHTLSEIERHAKRILRIGTYCLVQDYIDEPEYRVLILDGTVLAIYLKHSRGSKGEIPTLLQLSDAPAQVLQTALDTHHTLGLRYSGADVCLPGHCENAIVLEINSNPGLDFFERHHEHVAQAIADKLAKALLELKLLV